MRTRTRSYVIQTLHKNRANPSSVTPKTARHDDPRAEGAEEPGRQSPRERARPQTSVCLRFPSRVPASFLGETFGTSELRVVRVLKTVSRKGHRLSMNLCRYFIPPAPSHVQLQVWAYFRLCLMDFISFCGICS